MITRMTFTRDYRVFKKGETFILRSGLNCLVGDQGTGKSSLIDLLYLLSKGHKEALDIELLNPEKEIAVIKHDFESDSPRAISDISTTKMSIGTVLSSRWSSHGETVKATLKALNSLKEPSVVLMDEPDMALSIRSCFILVNLLKKLEAKGHQIIASIHNPTVINQLDKVLCLEDKLGWIEPREFFKLQENVK